MSFRDRALQLREAVEERAGITIQPRERVEYLEEAARDRRVLAKELQELGYTALNHRGGGSKHELKPEERRKLAQKARVVWMKDAMAGAAIDLMNEFVFGRGLPKPKAADTAVQEVIDEFWNDPDNQLILTSLDAQLALGTDLAIQSNLFILVFDEPGDGEEGSDGRVKLAILEHDSVERPVRDRNFRQRVLYFLAYEMEGEHEWDFEKDEPLSVPNAQRKPVYYAHWRNVDIAKEEAERTGSEPPPEPPEAKLGQGKVFHIAVNRTTEMAFGHPTFDRLIRWFSAYNRFLEDRLDIMHAKAAFIMERKVKGSPGQLDKVASRAISVAGELGAAPDGTMKGPEGAGNWLNANEAVEHRELSLDTGAAGAEQDGRMVRAPISAATRFPQTYFGDMSSGTLATSTSLELPVLKAVDTRQEFFEMLVRFGVDRAIEKAVESGRISEELTADELAKAGTSPNGGQGEGEFAPQGPQPIQAGYDGQGDDELTTKRDLSYEFKMPNPLKRMLGDLITAVMNVARTFDPNNTNPELSRALLTIALQEGFEVEDAPAMVDRIFPEGYVDPAVAAAQQVPPGPVQGEGEFAGAPGADGDRHTEANPYGAPMRAQNPEQVAEARVTFGRDGQPVRWPVTLEEAVRTRSDDVRVVQEGGQPVIYLDGERIVEGRYSDLPADVRRRHEQRLAAVESEFDQEVLAAVTGPSSTNGRNHP